MFGIDSCIWPCLRASLNPTPEISVQLLET